MEEAVGLRGHVANRLYREQLIAGTIEQSAFKASHRTGDGIRVVDGGDDVALRRQVFCEVTQERSRTGIAVRDNHQRELFSG